ncbi:MAG: hypothetical protein ACREBE_13780 [bacterium]
MLATSQQELSMVRNFGRVGIEHVERLRAWINGPDSDEQRLYEIGLRVAQHDTDAVELAADRAWLLEFARRLSSVRAQIVALHGYAQHRYECRLQHGDACSCGLAEFLPGASGEPGTCSTCDGSGEVEVSQTRSAICINCNGRGTRKSA